MKNLLHKAQTLSVTQKMYAGFGVVLLILALVGAQTLSSLLSIKHSTHNVVAEHQPAVITSLQLAENVKDALAGLGFYLLSKEASHRADYLRHLKQADAQLAKLRAQHSIAGNPTALALVGKIAADLERFKSYQATMFELATNDAKNLPAMTYSAKNINPLSQQVLQNINTMLAAEQDTTEGPKRLAVIKLLNEMRYSWARLMSGIRAYLGFRNQNALDEIRDQREYFLTQLKKLKNDYGDHLGFEQEAAMEELEKMIPDFGKNLDYVIKLQGGDQWRQDAYLVRSQIGPLVQQLNADIGDLVDNQVRNIDRTSGALIDESTHAAIAVIAMLLLAMGAVATLAYMLSRGIIRPMSQAVDSGMQAIRGLVQDMSDDSGKVLETADADRADQIGNVAHTFDLMAGALHASVQRQRASTDELRRKVDHILDAVKHAADGDLTSRLDGFGGNDAVDELADGVAGMITSLNTLVTQVQQAGIQVGASATEIAATAKQQEATAAEQAASTNEIMATVAEISATARELVGTMDEVAGVSDSTAASAAEGQQALEKMEATMQRMRAATDAITGKLAVLNEKATNIGTVVTTINKVADQTNLLSLNAAIEAEKAGEYGRGFAVVATEIRRLADQTAVATWDIEQMVKEVQSAVSAGVMGMDKFSEEVSSSADEVRQVGGQLTQIIDQVQTLSPRFVAVNEGMQTQALAAGQISDSMTQLNETAQQTAESLRQSGQSILQLKDATQRLQGGVSRFRVSAA